MLQRILDSKWTYIVGIGVLLVAAVASQFELRLPARPEGTPEDIASLSERDDVNVVFIMIDTLRNGRMGSYGYERDTSPVMDALAETGVRFAHAEAQSTWTKTSMASQWTGLNSTRTGITRYDHAIPEQATMPAEIFREAGYRTFGVFRNGWVENNFGFDQGFDTYYKAQPSRTPERFQRNTPGTPALQGTDLEVTQSGVEHIRANADSKFLLYLHYMDVHQYVYDEEAAAKGWGTTYSDAYDSAIHWVDRNVGRVVRELEEQGIADETLVIVSSDHGEAFYEHGTEGHAKNLYREVTEVPLILSLPFRLPEGVVVQELVRNLDLWPTVLDLLGLPPLPDPDGRSLVPVIRAAARGDGAEAAEAAPSHALSFLDRHWGQRDAKPRPLYSVRRGPFRLLYEGGVEGSAELYDHRSDPTEQTNLAGERPELVAELRASSQERVATRPPWDTKRVKIGDMRLNQLRALGYKVD